MINSRRGLLHFEVDPAAGTSAPSNPHGGVDARHRRHHDAVATLLLVVVDVSVCSGFKYRVILSDQCIAGLNVQNYLELHIITSYPIDTQFSPVPSQHKKPVTLRWKYSHRKTMQLTIMNFIPSHYPTLSDSQPQSQHIMQTPRCRHPAVTNAGLPLDRGPDAPQFPSCHPPSLF